MNELKLKALAAGLLLSLSSTHSIAGESYCAAIRGNGDAMPSHWGAMSQVVQRKGLPTAMAGGSSASITMFLIESLSLNSKLTTPTEQALMIKSFQGYFEALTQTPEGKALIALISDSDALKAIAARAMALDSTLLDGEGMAVALKHLDSIQTLLESDDLKDLINPEFLVYVMETKAMTEQAMANPESGLEGAIEYRKSQIRHSIVEFGKFNAETDMSLFFRPGLVSFAGLARAFGRMADFYAGYQVGVSEIQEKVDADIATFLSLCAPGSESLTWQELVAERPHCRSLLGRAVLTYREGHDASKMEKTRVYENIGAHLATFPTTSVLVGDAITQYNEQYQAFRMNQDPDFGGDLLLHSDDLKFGYWGNQDHLETIKGQFKEGLLYKADAKTQRFFSLGDAPWIEALSTSPAEPGLARVLPIRDGLLSAGGWSDLHPTLVLQAHGCQNIVYVTRRGGESFFAQGVIKRLLDIKGYEFSQFEGMSAEERRERNARGIEEDVGPQASEWSRLYNMANPQSSLRRSLRTATSIVCTDWDRTNSRADMNPMIKEAFTAPILKANELCL
jgi:hypothetical protein